MRVRKPVLPSGWYPQTPASIETFISRVRASYSSQKFNEQDAIACIVPHAGWTFSGSIALSALLSLKKDPETIVVLGGHLGPSQQPLMLMEDGAETPFGIFPIDVSFRNILLEKIQCKADVFQDNTVEVQLPFLHYLFPESQLLWMRMPANMISYELGKTIAAIAAAHHKDIRVVGSTDLTHYGPNYDFTPMGDGETAYQWVTKENDASFIKAILAMDRETVLQKATNDLAACSVGAVLGIMGFGELNKTLKPELLAYGTSRDVYASDSFVGYASIIWH
ncbi:AmmeMemoRadiSam system protein B [Gracilinema caldarium]|uniref:AmmeMemoRadiSam system protein B n=1 Tax=Gracilinema caldarium TaxID=215591 RepID=UPI0026EDEE04|nr:AmmeMemoRadiSam system protein B [Gracilinema caldarium]